MNCFESIARYNAVQEALKEVDTDFLKTRKEIDNLLKGKKNEIIVKTEKTHKITLPSSFKEELYLIEAFYMGDKVLYEIGNKSEVNKLKRDIESSIVGIKYKINIKITPVTRTLNSNTKIQGIGIDVKNKIHIHLTNKKIENQKYE